jgi:hypothetical protein
MTPAFLKMLQAISLHGEANKNYESVINIYPCKDSHYVQFVRYNIKVLHPRRKF